MSLFGKEKVEEESRPTLWRRVTWDDNGGWALPLEGEQGTRWNFNLELPVDAEALVSVTLGEEYYVVTYKVKNLGVYPVIHVREWSEEGNFIAEFGVHISGQFEYFIKPWEIDKARGGQEL